MTEEADGTIFSALQKALEKEGAMLEVVAPRIGGVRTSKGQLIKAQQNVAGGPSVLYDAVVLLPGVEGAKMLCRSAAGARFCQRCFCPLQIYRLLRGCSAAAGSCRDCQDA